MLRLFQLSRSRNIYLSSLPLLSMRNFAVGMSQQNWQDGIRENHRPGTPTFDVVELKENPKDGFLSRALYHGKSVEMIYYPQMGPRKTDPNDPMPQFDFKKRVFMRLNKSMIGSILAVCENKLPEFTYIAPYGGKLSAKLEGNDCLKLSLETPNENGSLSANVEYRAYSFMSFKYFLEFSLEKSFGFSMLDKELMFKMFQEENKSTPPSPRMRSNNQSSEKNQRNQRSGNDQGGHSSSNYQKPVSAQKAPSQAPSKAQKSQEEYLDW